MNKLDSTLFFETGFRIRVARTLRSRAEQPENIAANKVASNVFRVAAKNRSYSQLEA